MNFSEKSQPMNLSSEMLFSSEDIRKAKYIIPIEHQLYIFLLKMINKWKPDFIIVIERKGTAILRALKEWYSDSLDWPWERVISSSVIDQVSNDFLSGKNFLIFDEMMKTGEHLRDLLKKLRARGLWHLGSENVHIAIFAIHETSSSGLLFDNNLIKFDWFYRGLSTNAYRSIRKQIINMLQNAGSLMLDTEHIEVRVQVNCSFIKFINAIRRRSKVLVFNSSVQNKNITVYYEDDEPHEITATNYPEGSILKNIVKKCRFVQRKIDEFAIIPICYPSILEKEEKWLPSVRKDYVELFGEEYLKTARGRFYAVALYAALETLGWVLKDLATLDLDDYSLSLPKTKYDKRSFEGYCLDHLYAIYPKLNMQKLSAILSKISDVSHKEGSLLKKIKIKLQEFPILEDSILRRDAIILIQLIWFTIAKRIEEYKGYMQSDPPHPFGLQTSEIFDIGRKLGWKDIWISTLFDILIDEAYLVTHAQEIIERSETKRLVRTFEPDGEMVSELLERFTYQWGLPYGF